MLVRRTVTLQAEKEDKLVGEFAAHYGMDFSSALRFILNDWFDDCNFRPDVLQEQSQENNALPRPGRGKAHSNTSQWRIGETE